MSKILERDIGTLKLEKNVINTLKENDVNTIYDLCNFSRMELSDVGLAHGQINDISISLQLLGIDLKKNHAKRNTSIDSMKKYFN